MLDDVRHEAACQRRGHMEHLTASRRQVGGPDEDKGLRTFVNIAGELRAHDHRRIGAGAAVGAVGAEGSACEFRAGAAVVAIAVRRGIAGVAARRSR